MSQLPISPEFRALSTRPDLWFWFVLRQVHLKQSCSSSSSRCTARAMGTQPPHLWLPTRRRDSIAPKNTPASAPSGADPMPYARASSQGNGRQGATSQPRAPHAAQGCSSLASPAGVNQQECFQGGQSHTKICRFTRAELVPCYFSLPPGCYCTFLPPSRALHGEGV